MSSSVPFELVDEEEMHAIEMALQQAQALYSRSSYFLAAGASIINREVRASAARTSSDAAFVKDIEDGAVAPLRFPLKKSLCVTDLTALEWCEKQVEFSLTRGKPKKTTAMHLGSARHLELETEVVTRVQVDVESREDIWAVKLLSFMTGTRQLLVEGLTRELPVLAFVEGQWWSGIIDELRLAEISGPQLIDTKTRVRQSLPSEAQKRNGRLQLMCYKLLWDTLCEHAIPFDDFLLKFQLDPRQELSQAVRAHVADLKLGSKVDCLDHLLKLFRESCTALPIADQVLKLRYEWQVDRSLIGEEEFVYDPIWLKERVEWHLQFWEGNREAELVLEDESWKCGYCPFVEKCPARQRSRSL